MIDKPRLTLMYTNQQWIKIDDAAIKAGKKGTLNYIILKIRELENECEVCPDCLKEKLVNKQRRIYPLSDTAIEIVSSLEERLGIPPSTIVSRLILNPLLQ